MFTQKILTYIFIISYVDKYTLNILEFLVIKLYSLYLYSIISFILAFNSISCEKQLTLLESTESGQGLFMRESVNKSIAETGYYKLYLLPHSCLTVESFQKDKWLVRNSDKSFVNGKLKVSLFLSQQVSLVFIVSRSGCVRELPIQVDAGLC